MKSKTKWLEVSGRVLSVIAMFVFSDYFIEASHMKIGGRVYCHVTRRRTELELIRIAESHADYREVRK
jgi:hypothetical protein